MKKVITGGVDSVRVVNLPTGMKDGGDLSVPPPKSLELFEGFKAGPNQFMLPEEETVIPSEPNVQPLTLDQRGDVGGYAVPDKPMSSEPFFDTDMGTLRPEVSFEERFWWRNRWWCFYKSRRDHWRHVLSLYKESRRR